MVKDTDTAIGGGAHAFPSTPSAVLGVRDGDPVRKARAFSTLVRVYWKPVYKRIRIRFQKSNEDAKDLTQSFFARALERGIIESYDPDQARFRTFVRACLDNFVSNAEEARLAQKRGGTSLILSLDFHDVETELEESASSLSDEEVESMFDQDWARSLLSLVLVELRETNAAQSRHMFTEVFERYDLVDEDARPTYAALASALDLKVSDVTNYLHAVRKQFRAIALAKLREVTASEEEFRNEAIVLLGVDVPVDEGKH